MNKTWDISPLKDICTVFTDGNWIESKHQSEEGIRLIQTGNIGFGYYKDKSDKSRYISEEIFLKLKCTEILPGDLLVSRLPDPVGKSCIIPNINSKMITGVDCTIIRLKEILISEYLLYYQMSLQYLKDVESKVSGTTRSRISRKNLGLISIPYPKKEIQQQIVEILDTAFEALEKAKTNLEKNLANTKELFASKLNEIFSQKGEGWNEKNMNDICSIESTLIDPRNEPYLNMIHIGGGNIISESGELIKLKTSKEEELKSGKFNFNNTMILYNKIRPYLVKVCRPDFEGICSADIYPLSPNLQEVTKDFLYYILISKTFTDYAIKGSARAGMPKVNRKHLFDYSFYAPSVEMQNKIINKLDKLLEQTKQLEKKYQQKLDNLEELKKSLLQKAFSGELTK